MRKQTPSSSSVVGRRPTTTTSAAAALRLGFLCLSASTMPRPAGAALPSASLDVYSAPSWAGATTRHLSRANFGPVLPMGPRLGVRPDPSDPSTVSMGLALAPKDDGLLCNEADGLVNYTNVGEEGEGNGGVVRVYADQAVLVPRGGCTFERKVLSAQRLGASGAVIYNALGSRYTLNETNFTNITTDEPLREPTFDDIVWPRSKHDYDCDYARADVPKSALSFDPLPYNEAVNDPLLTGTSQEGNLCAVHNDASKGGSGAFSSPSSRCPSQRCLLTGKEDPEKGTMEACCAWDIHIDMNGDGSLSLEGAEAVVIPSLFATMAQGSELLEALEGGGAVPPAVGVPISNSTARTSASAAQTKAAEASEVNVVMYSRWYPSPNASSFLLWLLGTFVTWVASYRSASDYRSLRRKATAAVAEGRLVFRNRGNGGGGDDDEGTVMSEEDARDEEAGAETAAAEEAPADVETGPAASPPPSAFERSVAAAAAGQGDGFDHEEDALADVDPENEDKADHVAVAAAAAPPVRASFAENAFEDEPDDDGDGVGASAAADGDAEARRTDPWSPRYPRAEEPRPAERGQEQQQRQQQPPPPTRQPPPTQQRSPPPPPPQALELNAWHVAAFIVFASVALFVLFFFKIYTVVRIMYGLGCSGAMAQVCFAPLYGQMAKGVDWIRTRTGGGAGGGDKRGLEGAIKSSVCHTVTCCGCNEVTWLEVVSVLSGYAVGISWLWVGFNYLEPDEIPFFWIAQDVMGASICVAFLGLIRLNSIKIATLLLVAAFIYDIFFVFITPYIFDGDSVMITVATSGGPPDADPDYCEKYPAEDQCQGGDPLPMLLTVPRVNDYRGGSNLLGLGDVVLPGLLISFASRLDAAGKLVRFCTSAAAGGAAAAATVADDAPAASPFRRLRSRCSPRSLLCGSYLLPLTIAYAIGLLLANGAVHLMRRGQPALLYLVPACLGTMLVVGKVRGELGELWRGPDVLRRADRISGQLGHLRGGQAGGTAAPPPPASAPTPAAAAATEMARR